MSNTTDWKPRRKVTASTAGAAFGYLVTWVLSAALDLNPPIGVEAATTTLGAFAFGWLVNEEPGAEGDDG